MSARPQFQPLSASELTRYKRGGPGSPQQKSIRIADMGFDPEVLSAVSPKILELTDRDLQDLATKLATGTTGNQKANALNIQELQGIEYIFKDYREQKLATIASSIGDAQSLGSQSDFAAEWSVSCCCCTPCCCCAAVDMNPFETVN